MKQADPFYTSPDWRTLRLEVLKRDGYRCVVCRRSIGGKGQARVDHIKPRKQYPELALVADNCRSLCADHDNQSHREKGSGSAQREERFVVRGCDVDGMPLDPNHRWNSQAPRRSS